MGIAKEELRDLPIRGIENVIDALGQQKDWDRGQVRMPPSPLYLVSRELIRSQYRFIYLLRSHIQIRLNQNSQQEWYYRVKYKGSTMELRFKASLNLYINSTNIFIRRLLQEHKVLIKRAYVVSHKIKLKQSRKTEKKEKRKQS